MEKDSFILYGRQAQALTDLTLEQKGMLLDALFEYANTKVKPVFDDMALTIAFNFLSLQISIDKKKYDTISEKRREAINKRWNKEKQINTKDTNDTNEYKRYHNDNDNDNDNESTNVDINKKKDTKEKDTASNNADCLSFDIFWETYGNKKDKKHSLSAWNRLSKKDKQAALDGIQPYKKDCENCKRTMKYPATYLNGRTWEDEFVSLQVSSERKELPAGLDEKTWVSHQAWMNRCTPRIYKDIDPETFLKMKAIAHRKGNLFAEILVEIDKSGFTGDYVKEFQRLAQTDKYFHRIQA